MQQKWQLKAKVTKHKFKAKKVAKNLAKMTKC